MSTVRIDKDRLSLRVANCSSAVEKEHAMEIFNQFGDVIEVDRDTINNRVLFVRFGRTSHMENAYCNLNGSTINEKEISITFISQEYAYFNDIEQARFKAITDAQLENNQAMSSSKAQPVEVQQEQNYIERRGRTKHEESASQRKHSRSRSDYREQNDHRYKGGREDQRSSSHSPQQYQDDHYKNEGRERRHINYDQESLRQNSRGQKDEQFQKDQYASRDDYNQKQSSYVSENRGGSRQQSYQQYDTEDNNNNNKLRYTNESARSNKYPSNEQKNYNNQYTNRNINRKGSNSRGRDYHSSSQQQQQQQYQKRVYSSQRGGGSDRDRSSKSSLSRGDNNSSHHHSRSSTPIKQVKK